jgi:diacylglycerol O-acyltransferase
MSDAHNNEPLSFQDAFFLYLEQPGAPLNVASISAFEGVISLDDCMEYVEPRLPLLPRFLQRVVPPPLGIGTPLWQYDGHFDIRNHVHEITLKRGTEAEWKAAVSQLMSTNFDRSRPLWDITLFQGLRENQTGVVVRCHHCLVDGVAGVGMLRVLLDQNPVPPTMRNKKRPAQKPVENEAGPALLDSLINSCFSTAQALLTAHSELLRMAEQASHSNKKESETGAQPEGPTGALARIAPLGDLARLLAELAKPTERLPFNVLCHGPQKFEWAELSMAQILAIKQKCNTTVNDVVLTVMTLALRKYAELHDVNIKGRKLRLVAPVNARSEATPSGMGNQITFLPVDIPFDVREPRKLLATVQKRVGFSRTAHAAELVALAGVVLSAIPSTLQSLTGTILSQLPISLCNSICTNVHGPDTPLYLLGRKMLSSYPYVPIGGEMGMNCAVLSYNGTLFVGFTGDAQAIPDLSLLSAFFVQSFAELRDAAGIHIPPKKRERSKVVRSKPKAQPEVAKEESTETAASDNASIPKVSEAAAASA